MSSSELSPSPRSRLAGSRAGQALRARHNWEQLLKFSVVGARRRALPLGLLLALALVALALLPPPRAAATLTSAVFDDHGRLIESPITPTASSAAQVLNEEQALSIFEQYPKVAHWLKHYRPS